MDVPDDALRSGRNRIELAFSRTAPSGSDDERRLAALFRSIELVPKSDDFASTSPLQEHPDTSSAASIRARRSDDMTFVWSDGPVSEVGGDLAWPRSTYVLETLAEALPLVSSQQTRVLVNGTFVGMLSFQKKWTTQRLLIPSTALARGHNRIRFEYEGTVSPASVTKKARDERELAVRFRRITLSPLRAGTDLDFGTESARPFLISGWSTDERDGDRTVVWSSGSKASVAVSFQGVKTPVLRLEVQGYGRALPMNVTVSLRRGTDRDRLLRRTVGRVSLCRSRPVTTRRPLRLSPLTLIVPQDLPTRIRRSTIIESLHCAWTASTSSRTSSCRPPEHRFAVFRSMR